MTSGLPRAKTGRIRDVTFYDDVLIFFLRMLDALPFSLVSEFEWTHGQETGSRDVKRPRFSLVP